MIFLVLKIQNLLQNLKVAVHMRVFCAQRIVPTLCAWRF